MEEISSPTIPTRQAAGAPSPERGKSAGSPLGARLLSAPVVAAIITAFGAELLLAHTLLLLLPPGRDRLSVVGVASVAGMLLSVVLVRLAARARDPAMAAVWCVVGGAALGCAESALVGGASALVRALPWSGVAMGALRSAMSGSMLFIPSGIALGLTYAVVVLPAERARSAPSFDAADHLLAVGGAWLATLGILVAYLGSGSALSLLGGGATLLGVVMTLTGQVRTEDRVAWIRRVQAGREPWFLIDAVDDAGAGAPPLIAAHGGTLERDGVLLAVDPARPDYRGADVRSPLATLPLDVSKPLPTAWGGRLDASGSSADALGFVRHMGATVLLSAGGVALVTAVTRGMQHFFQLAGAYDTWAALLR